MLGLRASILSFVSAQALYPNGVHQVTFPDLAPILRRLVKGLIGHDVSDTPCMGSTALVECRDHQRGNESMSFDARLEINFHEQDKASVFFETECH